MTLVEYLEGELRRYFPQAIMLSVELFLDEERIEASVANADAPDVLMQFVCQLTSDDDWYIFNWPQYRPAVSLTVPLAPEGSIHG